MNDIFTMDYSTLLPSALTHDPKMVALARTLAAQLLDISGHINDVLIYSNFDHLPEDLVDILAYDMHVDWYEYSYPLTVKRNLVRDSVKVHKKMGTKYAVETALGGLWPKSEVEEWYQYGGEPHHFRVVCDVTENRITASWQQLVNAVKMYKRLSSHLDSVVYQARVTCIIQTHTDYTRYTLPMTGKLKAGTHPHRNTIGRTGGAVVIVDTEAAGYTYTNPLAGTIPERNRPFQGRKICITAKTAVKAMEYTNTPAGVVEAGTQPGRAKRSGAAGLAVVVENATDRSTYTVPVAGTVPDRATLTQSGAGGVTGQVEGTAYHYTVKRCGSSRKL